MSDLEIDLCGSLRQAKRKPTLPLFSYETRTKFLMTRRKMQFYITCNPLIMIIIQSALFALKSKESHIAPESNPLKMCKVDIVNHEGISNKLE